MDGTYEDEVENPPEETSEEVLGGDSLPKPGDVIACDFRDPATTPTEKKEAEDLADAHTSTSPPVPPSPAKPAPSRTIKVMTWNVHRGYDLRGIKNEIARVNPDILFLQEVDMGCDRTDGEDVAAAIASALKYNLVFACEFEEIYSPLRRPEDQGGGVSGSAILSRYELVDVRGLVHKVRPVEWDFPGPLPAEPRRGLRITPFARAITPLGPIACYGVHLEEYCGIEARLEQFMEVMEDACALPKEQPVIIAGDFSTKAHGVARLSPWYCGDWMRVGTLGSTEAEVWEEMLWGDEELNPGFFDPFEEHVVTYSAKNGWLQAKTDHIRLRGFKYTHPDLGGKLADLHESPALSTHRWLSVNVVPTSAVSTQDDPREGDTAALLQAGKEWPEEAVEGSNL